MPIEQQIACSQALRTLGKVAHCGDCGLWRWLVAIRHHLQPVACWARCPAVRTAGCCSLSLRSHLGTRCFTSGVQADRLSYLYTAIRACWTSGSEAALRRACILNACMKHHHVRATGSAAGSGHGDAVAAGLPGQADHQLLPAADQHAGVLQKMCILCAMLWRCQCRALQPVVVYILPERPISWSCAV